MLDSLSVIIPAYQEELNIDATIQECVDILSLIAKNWEVIICDDGSTDETPRLVRRWFWRDVRIRLVRLPHKGYGSAIRNGIKVSRYDWLFWIDADGQFNLNDIKKLLPFVEGYDLIMGYRIHRQDPFLRRFYSACYNYILHWVFGVTVRDCDCSFKLFRRELVGNLVSDSRFIDAEFLLEAQKRGARIKQIGVKHYPRRAGQVSFEGKRGWVKINTIWQLVKDMINYKRGLYDI